MEQAQVFIINCAEAKAEALNTIFALHRDGPIMMVTVEPYSRKRTNPQNKAYWKVLLQPIEEATGTEAKIWHELFKKLFVQPDLYSMHGITFEVRETTTKMTTIEFMEYVESIRRWTAENLNLVLPEIDPTKRKRG